MLPSCIKRFTTKGKQTLSNFLEKLLITKNESNLSIKQVQQSLAEYKFSQNTNFIYRRVPGMAWNILRNVSLQFTGIFYLHFHPYSSLAKTCFLYQTGFLPGFKFSTSYFICVLNLNILLLIFSESIDCEREEPRFRGPYLKSRQMRSYTYISYMHTTYFVERSIHLIEERWLLIITEEFRLQE